jgi:hypothetical protein
MDFHRFGVGMTGEMLQCSHPSGAGPEFLALST